MPIHLAPQCVEGLDAGQTQLSQRRSVRFRIWSQLFATLWSQLLLHFFLHTLIFQPDLLQLGAVIRLPFILGFPVGPQRRTERSLFRLICYSFLLLLLAGPTGSSLATAAPLLSLPRAYSQCLWDALAPSALPGFSFDLRLLWPGASSRVPVSHLSL